MTYLSFLANHIAPILISYRKNGDEGSDILTAFVLSVSNRWFLITAGHCLTNIKQLLSDGYQIVECSLIDSLGPDAGNRIPIPFPYEPNNALVVDNDEFDYGAIALSDYYRRLMEKNNIRPLNEEVWLDQPTMPEAYVLCGFPAETTKFNTAFVETSSTQILIRRIENPTDLLKKVRPGLFYGQIRLDQDLKSIKGMSGGPIFAFQKDKEGRIRYWLVGLQSSWVPDKQIIIAHPITVLGKALRECFIIRSLTQSLAYTAV